MKRKMLLPLLLLPVLLSCSKMPVEELNCEPRIACVGNNGIKRVENSEPKEENRYETNRVVVTFTNEFSEEVRQNGLSSLKGLEKTHENLLTSGATELEYYNLDGKITVYVPLKTAGIEEAKNAVNELLEDPRVSRACLNIISTLASLPDEDLINGQWPFVTSGQANIGVESAWSFTTGYKKVRVGIIDSGIKGHVDLIKNLESGYDFAHNNETTNELTNNDHGTCVAGVIAAEINGKGIAGIAPNVSLVPLQCGGDNGSVDISINQAIRAVNYATSLWGTDKQISVLNFSVAGFGYYYDENGRPSIWADLLEAIKNFPGIFVWAAGNENKNVDNIAGASNFIVDNLISVGGLYESLEKVDGPEGSSYGNCVDIFAPGANILTTCGTNGYCTTGGTSLAAPFVSATAALLYSKYPNLTARQVKKSIWDSATFQQITTDSGNFFVKYLQVGSALSRGQYYSSSDPAYLRIGIDGKNGNAWTVSFYNDNDYDVNFVWNNKMCSLQDARNLSNLADITAHYIAARGKWTTAVEANGSATAVVGAITKKDGSKGKRYISYADGLVKNGNVCKSNKVHNETQSVNVNYSDLTSFGSYPKCLSFEVVSGSGWPFLNWKVNVRNNSNCSINVEYNSKMCFEEHAVSFSGLSDIKTLSLAARQTKQIDINGNYFADYIVASIVFSYGGIDVRRITYAKDLNTNRTIGTNKHKDILFLKNGPVSQNYSL